jgi:hypothetical protein
MDFDNYMDLKKPGFGGPSSAKMYRDARGKKVNSDPKLDGYQRTVDRHAAFSHPVYDPTYKAMSNDLVYKQENKKPYNYPDSYSNMGIPVVNVGKAANEGLSHTSFTRFVNEMNDDAYYGANPMGDETRVPCRNEDKAEDILMDMKIDWDGWDEAPVGNGKSFTKDGDIVAYFDDSVRPHQLVILPEAETMSDSEYGKIMSPDQEEEEEDEEEEIEDTFYKPTEFDVETEEEEEFEREAPKKDTKSIERMLKSFETDFDEEEEDEY